jgi:hypothetical protein
MTTPRQPKLIHWVTAGELVLDREFANLLPGLLPDEQSQRELTVAQYGCTEPLLVWLRQGRRILLVGYEVLPLLRAHGKPIPVVERAFAGQDDARMFIIKHRLAGGHFSTLAISYLRGLRYHAEKQPHGGDRKSDAVPFPNHRSAEALAELFFVSPATIRRDGAIARAVDIVVENCGADTRPLLLARGAKLSCGDILALAKKPAERQRAVIGALALSGQRPRGWRADGAPASISLPREPRRLAEVLLRRQGRAFGEAVAEHLAELLAKGKPDRA